MFKSGTSTRRDARYPLPGSSGIEFDHPIDGRRCVARLTTMGVAGMAFVVPAPSIDGLGPGTTLTHALVRVDNRVLHGDIVVCSSSPGADGGATLGGLFYPANRESDQELVWIVAELMSSGSQPASGTTHIRCGQCHDSVPIVLEAGRPEPIPASCTTCGQPYEMPPFGGDAATPDSLFMQVRRLALENGIDMPGARSVLLGVMDVDQVRALQEPSTGVAHPHTRKMRYDLAFRPAVEAGTLTAETAFERGKREAWATRLAAKHRLDMESALAVADNRISLLEAIRQKRASSRAPVRLALPGKPSRTRVGLMAALIGTVGFALFSPYFVGSRDRDAPRDDARIEVLRADDGRILRIEGPDPTSVLEAYCESSDPDRKFEAAGLMPSGPERSDLTLGILRDPSARDDALAIYIAFDRPTRRWTAGNGRSPLEAFRAPEAEDGALQARRSGP